MRNSRTNGIARRDALKLGLGAAGACLMMSSGGAFGAQTDIPKVTLRAGTIPFASATWFQLAARNGFLDDVGITMVGGSLPGTPRIVNENQVVPQLVNEELDISGTYAGAVIQALDKVSVSRPFLCYSYFEGRAILVKPDSGYKTVTELLDEGLSWAEATKTAIAQMRGKKFSILNQPSARPFAEFALAQGGLTFGDVEIVPIEDPKAVQLAVSGQVEFAAPSGAVQLFQLIAQAGFKPLIDMNVMLNSMPKEAGDLSQFLSYDLLMCTEDFASKNEETLYRFCGAMYRTIDYMFGPKKAEAMAQFAPYLNSITGASLDAESLEFIFTNMTIFRGWSGQSEFWTETSSPVYYKNIFEPQLKKLIADGAIEDRPYNLDELFLSKTIWERMARMRSEAESLLTKGSEGLSGVKLAQFEAARTHFDQFNFFDAERFVKEAFA